MHYHNALAAARNAARELKLGHEYEACRYFEKAEYFARKHADETDTVEIFADIIKAMGE